MKVTINVVGKNGTLRFAAEELSRYLQLSTGRKIPILNINSVEEAVHGFVLGLCHDLRIACHTKANSENDCICIKRTQDKYLLGGSNARSVLFATYRYLREIGFRWIRPGNRGEIIPKLENPFETTINITEVASYYYRTICIEGACSYEHVRDIIDWGAKHGINGYFLQFDLGIPFWERWYEDTDNPYRKGSGLSKEEIKTIVNKITDEIKKRGLRFERMGHGWTARAIGLGVEGWKPTEHVDIPQEKREWIAEIKGKREFFGGVPIDTNLCYSNPKVREAITDSIVAYISDHPDVDAVHFWLADGSNNHCECKKCKGTRPSDFYIDMLNEVDKKLSSANIDKNIVFLIYLDLFWPPLKKKIKNKKRFVLMFAPITRSYKHSFLKYKSDGDQDISKYRRNKLKYPSDVNANIQYLKAWQKIFDGRGFLFDYHLLWPPYYDINQFSLARVLHKDIQGLCKLKLDGFNSCQNQRISFPHNLLLDVMAETLWDKKKSFEEIVNSTFADSYGKNWEKVVDHFDKMSRLWEPIFEPVFDPKTDLKRLEEGKRNLKEMKIIVNDFRQIVAENLKISRGAILWSWKYLEKYIELMTLLLPAFEAYLERSSDCRKRFHKVFDFLWRNEKELHPALDVWMFIKVLRRRIIEVESKH
ncbi:MAG: DUF4838 domain-containing protein [Candidatus Bathyarchaeia archaeon]